MPRDSEESLPTAGALERPGQGPSWGDGTGRSYFIPAAEIVGFEFLLNAYDRRYDAEDAYRSDSSSIKQNLHRGWIIDDDPFATNQVMHPYQGSLVHGFARSAGLTYWEALAYDAAGSALWEVAGETGPPSANDLITTTFGGSFLGEALFRMASLLLESGGRNPGILRELGAAMISPPTGINRAAFGDRFDGVYPSHDPATFTRVGIGARRNARVTDLGALANAPRDEAVADFSMDYGLPGKPGYEYKRPFDYFQFEVAATSSSHALPESVMTRALLYGSGYELGGFYRGIWGLYGSYDYMSPEVFSVSSTALSLGTTGQYRISDAVALQGTCLAGLGWTAVGTIADARTDRDFHYGYSPQGLVALRLIFGSVAMLDMAGREYYVGGLGSHDAEGRENILRGQVSLTVRIFGHHALGLQFVSSVRNSNSFDAVGGFEEV
ncbi:MAG TPA: DUF3943 domain-containing protein, partial [Planctomycetota bacterium]